MTGYSTNDTIVIFDRVRENLRGMRRDSILDTINTAVNQTLNRTVLTAGTTLLSAVSLYLFGGEVLRGFAFTMIVGVITGPTERVHRGGHRLVLADQGCASRAGGSGGHLVRAWKRPLAGARKKAGPKNPRILADASEDRGSTSRRALGIVQGLTEFLPVSSSAHLILARLFFGWDAGQLGLAFDVACHVGTLAAVVAYFRSDLLDLGEGRPPACFTRPSG